MNLETEIRQELIKRLPFAEYIRFEKEEKGFKFSFSLNGVRHETHIPNWTTIAFPINWANDIFR